MSSKISGRKAGNCARAQRQGGRTQRLAAARGISVENPCSVLVMGTTGAGRTDIGLLRRLAALASRGAAAMPSGPKGNGENQQRTPLAEYTERNDRRLS